MSEPFGLVARFTLKEGAAGAFDTLTAETVERIRAHEEGTRLYVVAVAPEQPAVRVFYEVYRNRQAFEEHEAQPHVRRFLAERGRHVADLEVTFLTPLVAKGLDLAQPST